MFVVVVVLVNVAPVLFSFDSDVRQWPVLVRTYIKKKTIVPNYYGTWILRVDDINKIEITSSFRE